MKRIALAFLFLAIGIGLLFASYKINAHEASFRTTAVKATGQVVDLIAKSSSGSGKSSTTYAPKIQFADAMGHSVTFVSSVSSNPPSYKPGDSVPILYQPKTPENAQVDSWFSRWGGVVIAGGIGAVFSLVGVLSALAPGVRT